ncbi:modifier of mdg4-like [Anopheles aquasalis]|uniref:modifier of mdg4-like n=1 Tax=Anopheles aquasalis TaxID=42839 RepID=UPI00215B511F|nr:modifier of mdg4-like [Anopheles aquasalis]
MCRDGDLVDVSLWCEGRRIRAHKALLAACSPYFKTVFKENPSQHPDIIFHNVRYSDLAAIVEYIYHGELMIAHDQLMSFLHTAKTLSIRGLVDASKEPQPPQHTVWSSSSTSQQQNLILTSPMLSEKNNVTQYPTSSSVSLDHQQQPTIAEMQAAPQLRQQEQTPLLSHQVQDEVQQLPQDIQQEQESQQLMQEMDVQTQQECQEQIMQCNTMQTVQTMETIEANPQEPTNEIVGATRTTLTDEIREQHNSENSNLDEGEHLFS